MISTSPYSLKPVAQVLMVLYLAATSLKLSAEPDQKAAPEPNVLTKAMTQAGVVYCRDHVQKVSDFLTKGSESGVSLQLPVDHVNDHLVSASLEVLDNSAVFYANMDFSPLVAYGCDASFEIVMYWPDKCDTVAKTQFSEAKNSGKLRKHISLLTYGDNLQIFLMPAGPGCVSIKKQTLFDKF
ncbi:hypothetical protein KEF85_10915 [Methylomonas paludis]|uniref:Uncharacterized protein n=1 Tax=Methylomonas paludis TaxID=1173101 RepID=A0A975MLQ3_9GAMM|nr:hypothetical protein [Methylomonas paludis]QWF69870.1 hypothetical protein KEF85_10915 [Methylomonas paludis]